MLASEYQAKTFVKPKHQRFYRSFQRKAPTLLNITEFEAQQDPQELKKLRDEARPEMDIFDTFLGLVRKNLDVSEVRAFEQALSQLSQDVANDLRVYLQEEYKLRHQMMISEIDPRQPLQQWDDLTHNSAEKAKVLLDGSETETEWIVNFIRLHRYLWENRQATEVKQFVIEQLQSTRLQAITSSELLGETTAQQVIDFGYKGSNPEEILDTGKLEQLGLQGHETVHVSPKFFLAMPENAFVHSGDYSYVNLYQVIFVPAHDSEPDSYYLLADMYFSRLSLEELKSTIQLLLPDRPLQPQISEKLILETTGNLPDTFTTEAPFKLFLRLAKHLDKEVAGIQTSNALSAVQAQQRALAQIQAKESDIQRAGTLLSHVLLTELALMKYLPKRGEYVSEILYRVFEMVIKSLLSGGTYTITDEVYTQILGFYHEYMLSQKEKAGRDVGMSEVLQPTIVRKRNNKALQKLLAPKERVEQTKRIRDKHQDLFALGNFAVMGVAGIVPKVLERGIGCAACGASSFAQLGGLKEVTHEATKVVSGSSSVMKPGFVWGSGSSSLREGILDEQDSSFERGLSSFLQDPLSDGRSVYNRFQSSFIQAGELLTYFINENAVLPHR